MARLGQPHRHVYLPECREGATKKTYMIRGSYKHVNMFPPLSQIGSPWTEVLPTIFCSLPEELRQDVITLTVECKFVDEVIKFADEDQSLIYALLCFRGDG